MARIRLEEKAEAIEIAGTEVLHDDVEVRDQPPEEVASPPVAPVQADALLPRL
jgi:hypothetical protein